MTKPHLSPTQMDMLARCPYSYKRSYLDGEKIPPKIVTCQGTATHHGAKVNFEQKIETHQDLPEKDIVEAAVEQFKLQAQAGGYSLTAEEANRGITVVVGEATDQVAQLARLHASEVAPQYQPVAVEQTMRVELPNAPRDLLGIVDLIDDRDIVVDHKVTGKPKSQHEVDHSVQLSFYAGAFRKQTGRDPSAVRLEVLIRKDPPKRQVLTSERNIADLQALTHRVNASLAIINNGVFGPATPGAWWCSDRWCGYWSSCPYVNSERVARSSVAGANATSNRRRRRQAQQAPKPLPPGSPADSPAILPEPKNDLVRLLSIDPHCHRCGVLVTRRNARVVKVADGQRLECPAHLSEGA